MITKETSNNKSAYNELYEKVTTVLNSKYISDNDKTTLQEILGQQDKDKITITSIDEYFSVLEILAGIVNKVISNETGYDASLYNDKLFIIPFDERDFIIDANSRKIGVPQEFSRNGVGVEGDHFVESLYFTIDRYFDTIDFAQSNIKAIIEWINAKGEKCYSPAWTKILSDHDTKVVIGWVLTDKVTEKAGVIKFSIRLYSLAEDGKLESSFATLVTSVIINPSMNFDLEAAGEDKVTPEFESSDRVHEAVFKRLRSSPAPNKTANDVPLPEYVIRYAKMVNGKVADAGNSDITDADAGETYYVWAKSNRGIVRYKWFPEGAYDPNATSSNLYVPVSFWDKDMEYFTKGADNKYVLAENVTESNITMGEYYTLMGKATLPSKGDVTGDYRCLAMNNQYGYHRPDNLDEMDKLSDETQKIGKITIKGPEDFTFSLANSEPQKTNANLTIVNEENKNDRSKSSYQWKYKTFDEGAKYTDKGIESSQIADVEGYWQAIVSHTKNGAVKSVPSGEVIVYKPIEKPVAAEDNKTGTIQRNKDTNQNIIWHFTVSGNFTEYSYQWYNSDAEALPKSKGEPKVINNGEQLEVILAADDINKKVEDYKLKITAKKTIGGVGETSWEDYGILTIRLIDGVSG